MASERVCRRAHRGHGDCWATKQTEPCGNCWRTRVAELEAAESRCNQLQGILDTQGWQLTDEEAAATQGWRRLRDVSNRREYQCMGCGLRMPEPLLPNGWRALESLWPMLQDHTCKESDLRTRVAELEAALVEARPHVYRQQAHGRHEQDRADAVAWWEKHGNP